MFHILEGQPRIKPCLILLLAALGLGLSYAVAQFQQFPGYLDSDYYFAGGLQLVQGRGFSEPYLWNYLDDPTGIPHPSHTYWMPLASIIAAGGMWITRESTYAAARLGFLLLAALVPVMTAALAFSFSRRWELALTSGLLGVFTIYYEPFLSVPDNYGPYLVLGATFFLVLSWRSEVAYLMLGMLAGFLTLARSDGILWLGLTVAVVVIRAFRQSANERTSFSPGLRTIARWSPDGGKVLRRVIVACAGFLLIMGAWLWRTYDIYGTLLAPGGSHLLWLTTYDETFAYPASKLTLDAWLSQGLSAIIGARLAALKWNLLNALAAQGGLFLAPFILVGLWNHRKDERIQIGVLAWLGLLFVMTLIFPFAGARGGFFHSGAALQALWWAMAPLGLESTIAAARRRNLFTPRAFTVFRAALVGLAALMTALILAIRVFPGWGEGEQNYPKLESLLESSGIRADEVVMVRNPPGYYIMTGRPAIVVPYADAADMLAAAIRYQAKYVLIESVGAAGPIKAVYDDTGDQHLRYVGELNGTRLFRVQP